MPVYYIPPKPISSTQVTSLLQQLRNNTAPEKRNGSYPHSIWPLTANTLPTVTKKAEPKLTLALTLLSRNKCMISNMDTDMQGPISKLTSGPSFVVIIIIIMIAKKL